MHHITAPELAAWLADASRAQPVLLDVREPWEVQQGMIDGAVALPMQSIPDRVQELDEDAITVCICHHGSRSAQVAQFLAQQGFGQVINLTGGMHAWATQVDTAMATY
jgi:rhodanese-related sulfurtransferase